MDPSIFLEVSDAEWAKAEEEQKASLAPLIISSTPSGNDESQCFTESELSAAKDRKGKGKALAGPKVPSPAPGPTKPGVEVAWKMLLNERQLQKEEFSHGHDVERLKKQYGEDHPYTIEGMKTLAYRYMHRENFKDAETVFLRVLELAKKNFGSEDLYTIELLFDVGLAFAGQAHFQETRRFLELFVHLGRQFLGRSSKTWTIVGNPSSVIEQQTLAALSKNLEAYVGKAESLIASMPTLPLNSQSEDTVNLLRAIDRDTPAQLIEVEDEEGFKDLELGFGKMETAVQGIKRQSLEYVNEGRWKKAEEYIAFMLGMHERILGSEHSETLAILDLLASLYEAHGQWDDAERQRAKLAKLVRRKRGDRDPETFLVETILARTAAKQGNERTEEAQEML
jgi:tetratricopeptide (TPR) repeat protein